MSSHPGSSEATQLYMPTIITTSLAFFSSVTPDVVSPLGPASQLNPGSFGPRVLKYHGLGPGAASNRGSVFAKPIPCQRYPQPWSLAGRRLPKLYLVSFRIDHPSKLSIL